MAKFKTGDKVRITAFKHGTKRYYEGGFNFDDELELVEDDICSHNCDICTCHRDTVTINNTDIPLNDKKEAHRVVHAMVEKAYQDAAKPVPKHESWSKADITLARDLVVAQADQVIRSGGDLYWHYTAKENEIEAVVYKSLSEPDNIRLDRAAPHHADDYNEWIGKCASLYKALNMDVPSFIAIKNMEG